MKTWTNEQYAAIRDRSGNLLVSAAAGSGKTTVMIERIVSLILEGKASLDSILVVTFTNAAAASMKEKLAERLSEEIDKNPGEEELHRQMDLLDHADISTIHAYCNRLLRRYYYRTELPPDFRIPDEAQENLICQNAMDATLEKAARLYEDGLFPAYADVLTQFAHGGNDNSLSYVVRQLSAFRAVREDPDAFKLLSLSLYEDENAVVWNDYCLGYAFDLLRPLKGYLDEVETFFRPTPIYEAAKKNLDYFYETLDRALSCKTLTDVLAALSGSQKSFKKNDAYPTLSNFYDRCRVFPKKVFENVKALQSVEGVPFARPAVEGLFCVTEWYEEACRALLLEEGCVSFDMILRETLNLLQSDPALTNELRSGLQYVFVDEYQDVNPLLNKLVETLSDKHNLFFVGDVKQSIYGFNNAHPDLFIGKMRAYDGTLGKRIDLCNSFRSAKPVLDGVNALFKIFMQEESEHSVAYDEAACLRPSDDPSSPQYKDAILFDGKKEKECEFLFRSSRDVDEGEALAQRILKLKNSEIYDRKEKRYRRVEYRDIVILGHKKAFAASFCRAFARHGIPYRVPQGNDGGQSESIGVLLAFLRLLLLRRDDLSLLTVLASPIGRFRYTELASVREAQPDAGSSFYDAFAAFSGDEKIVRKRDAFNELLDRMALLQGSMALPDFLETLCRETGYSLSLACEENSVEKLGGVERLIAAARRYSEQSSGGLRGFLSYAEGVLSQRDRVGESADAGNAVRFMTIHRSKGLEFPIVILTGLDKTIRMEDKNKPADVSFFCDDKLGVAFSLYRRDAFGAYVAVPSPAVTAISLKIRAYEKAENLRLLYVALTRAESKLILYCTALNNKGAFSSSPCMFPHAALASIYDCYNDLLLPFFYLHRDGGALRARVDHEEADYDFLCDSDWSVREATDDAVCVTSPEGQSAKPFDEKAFVASVEAALSWRYPYAAAVTARSKQAPSRSAVRTRPDLHRPQFADPEYTGAQKGTSVHFFMEHLDLQCKDDARAQAEKMRLAGVLQDEEFSAIPFDAVNAFLASPLGQRLKRARTVMRERPFCLIVPFEETGDESLVQGNIDCYFFEGDRIVLLDYKTDVIRGNLEARIDHHRTQMHLYKQALEKLYPGKAVEAYLHFFSVSRSIRVE